MSNEAQVKERVIQQLASKMGAHLVHDPSLTDADLFAIGGETTAYSEIIDTSIYMARRAQIEMEERYHAKNEPSEKCEG